MYFSQDLYEIAFVYGSLERFWIYSLLPRHRIEHETLVSTLTSPSVLVIEECEDAPCILNVSDKVCLYCMGNCKQSLGLCV